MLIPYPSKEALPGFAVNTSHCPCLREGSHVPRRGVWGGSFRWKGRDLVLLLHHGLAVWQSLEHLQSDPKSKVQTLEVTRTEAPDAQKEEPYLLRSEVVCAVAVEGICVIGVNKSSAILNLARI